MRIYIKNFMFRMLTGLLLIVALNFCFDAAGLSLTVGVNPITAVTAGAFGVPGVILLYGIVGCGG